MPSPNSASKIGARRMLQGTPYETIRPGKPPIPITVAPTPSSAQLDLHPSLRPSVSPTAGSEVHPIRSTPKEGSRRDSGLAQSHSTARESRTTFGTDAESATGIEKSQSLPRMAEPRSTPLTPPQARSHNRSQGGLEAAPRPVNSQRQALRAPDAPFQGLSTNIPTVSFEDLTSPGSIQFSKRGSILIGGKRASETYGNTDKRETTNPQAGNAVDAPMPRRALSHDEEVLSRRVRSMYEDESHGIASSNPMTVSGDAKLGSTSALQAPSRPSESKATGPLCIEDDLRKSFLGDGQVMAGGIEDWEDLHGGDVDRYGFINRRSANLSNLSSSSLPVSPSVRLHRVSTALQLASEAPRRNFSRLGRSSSVTKSSRSVGAARGEGGSKILRPLSSQSSYRSTASMRTSRLRGMANRLPHNRERRVVDEAGNMLTLPPGLADIAEHEEGGKITDTHKQKEWEREAKWRKMAKVERTRGHGGGMVFSFDTTNPKLVERTWKGIPDRWRATAWHSFLSTSAKRDPNSASDSDLKASFRDLLHHSSPDDVQIDIDVPRTINGHIMFRKRYRGGQRLLFRVLHCLSIFFPETGYVQGMAALAATLLCYFDEEMAFVMLVRMWQLRGLERLYRSGFEGLMQALQEFEEKWLKNGDIGLKLSELGITSTAYGTRWYLTVFNYSIPFPAQLRVWDVFLLLGDEDLSARSTNPASFHGQLDVLHATSTALIDATREILLDSDFENTMKVLTSWIPIRDEDMLLDVAKAEWKAYRKQRKIG